MSTTGTSIHDLYTQKRTTDFDQLMTNPIPNPNIVTNPTATEEWKNNNPNIKNLVNEINNDLEDDFDDVISEEDLEENIVIKKSMLKKIKENIYEPIILLLLYVLLSQGSVRIFIGRYVKQINPNRDGIVGLSGLIIYGLILAILHQIIKTYLIE